jgi:hypothetical protein
VVRTIAVTLVAMAAFDLLFADGKYLRAIAQMFLQ